MAIGEPLDNSWGAVLIGVFLAIFLYGLLTLQVYVYHEMFPRDVWWLKLVVYCVWILDTAHTIFITHMIYTNLITNFGDYDAIGHNTWSFNINVLITTVVASISQVFFIHRCWRFDKSVFNTIASAVILILAGVQFAFGSLCTHLTFTLSLYSQFLDYKWAVDTWLGSAAATDILVSCALVRSLLMKRNEVQRTRNLIERLIRWTVTTGMITSVWALLDLAVFTGSETTLIHLFFNIMLAKLYANTLLASLNHRTPHRPEDLPAVLPTQATGSISLSQFSPRGSVHMSRISGRSGERSMLTLTTTTTMASESRRGGRRTQSVSFALDSAGLAYDLEGGRGRGVRVDVETTLSGLGSVGSGVSEGSPRSRSLEFDGDGKSLESGPTESPSTSVPSMASPVVEKKEEGEGDDGETVVERDPGKGGEGE